MQEQSVTNSSRRLEVVVWGALFLTILAVAGAFIYKRLQPAAAALPVISPVGEFTLTNQFGKTVTAADFRGSPWLANIIFTKCAGPCPTMTKAMKTLQDATNPRLQLVTLTTDPDNDSPEVLKRYGEKYGADFRRWSFLTGTKQQLGRLAVGGLKLTALEKPPGERESAVDLFIHSTMFVLIDKKGNLRAAFELDDPDLKSKVARAAQSLIKEQ